MRDARAGQVIADYRNLGQNIYRLSWMHGHAPGCNGNRGKIIRDGLGWNRERVVAFNEEDQDGVDDQAHVSPPPLVYPQEGVGQEQLREDRVRHCERPSE